MIKDASTTIVRVKRECLVWDKEAEDPHTNTMFRIQEHENAHMVHDNQRKLEGVHGNTWTTSKSSQHPKTSTGKEEGQREELIPSM